MSWRSHFPMLLVVLCCPLMALAQGFILPPDRMPVTGSYAVKSVGVDASIKDGVAQVRMSLVFRNTSRRDMEVAYVFPVPPEAVIEQFVLMVDGKEMPARMYTREEAERIYEGIVRTKRDPAILEYFGYGAVKTNVFPLPAGGERQITLRYSQVCRRDGTINELMLPLTGGKLSSSPIEELKVTVRIDSAEQIKSVYSPTYAVDVERFGGRSAVARLTLRQTVPSDDLRLLWDFSDKPIGATLLTYRPNMKEDGYFLLLASPQVEAAANAVSSKTVILALDRSGSMAGEKIEQARNALKFVLNNLRDGDTFNIVAYDDRVESFRPELQRFDNQARADALHWVDGINAGGSTNIDGALRRAMELAGDTQRPTYILFMTDGLPTSGETGEGQIAANAKSANRSKSRLFAFGVGFDVNARLLDRLTTENSGTSEYVRPNENIEASVARFYGKMTAPVLTQVKVELAGTEMNRMYPRELPDLFAGGQIIAVGRYRGGDPSGVVLRGTAGGKEQVFEYGVHAAKSSGDDTYAFVARLWASRRIGDIINELDLHGRNSELVDELVRLSTQYGILTPYTAFLADERTNLSAARDNRDEAGKQAFDAPNGLEKSLSGGGGVGQRMAKARFQYAAQAGSGPQSAPDKDGISRTEDRVQVVGEKSLYKRGQGWVDPSVTEEDAKSAEQVEQFSDRYFELARSNAAMRQYLALPAGCIIRVDNKVYQINAARPGAGG